MRWANVSRKLSASSDQTVNDHIVTCQSLSHPQPGAKVVLK